LGRISSGILGDKFGAITVAGPLTLLCAVTAFVWPLVTTKGALIAVGITYGFCYGAYVTLLAAPVMTMGDMHDSGRRSGTFWTCMAFGAVVGTPISGAIAQATDGFKAVGCYAGIVLQSPSVLDALLMCPPLGSCVIGAVVFLYLTKYLMMGSLRGKC
jgi:MCP family monocarboxylic acid transporter-like MFS transporter 10